MRYKIFVRQESTGYVRIRVRELLPSQVDRLKVKLNKREGDFTLIEIKPITALE